MIVVTVKEGGAIYSQKLRSPLTEPGIGVKEGDYITAIDGISTATVDNIYSPLPFLKSKDVVPCRPSVSQSARPPKEQIQNVHYSLSQRVL